jgi:hypothetical protein
MTRLGDPDRIYQARRLAARSRLTSEGMDRDTADAWCDAWEREASSTRLPHNDSHFWSAGADWIRVQRAARRTPGDTP